MKVPRFLAAVSVGALVVAACSSSSATPSPTSAPTSVPATAAPTAAPTPTPTTPIKLAALIPNTSDPFWTTVSCGAKAEAAKLGADLKVFSTTGTDTNTIAQLFDSASLLNPQGMFADPFNNNQFATQYKDLMSKGVPIVTGNGTSPQVEYMNIFSGGDTGKLVPNVLSYIPAGAGKIVYMGGAPGIPPLETRTLPFFEAMKKARVDLTPLANEYSGFDVNKATSDVNSLIIAHPDLKLIIASNGPDGQAAAAAIKQSSKVGQIALIAFDAVPAEVAALRDGTISVLIAQAPGKIGSDSIKALVDYITAHPNRGAVAPAGSATIESGLLTKSNIDDPANADFIYKAQC